MAKDETERKIPMYVLTQEQINQIAAVAGEEAVKRFWAEQVKSDKKRAREENKVKKTKKMLSSYRRIKATLSDEVEFTEEEQIELRWKFIQDLMGNVRETVSRSERTIKDGEKRRQEDLYCIYRIEKATEMYREECEKSGSEEAKRRYRELSMMYLEEKQYSVQEISEVENVSDKTVYKDLGIACGIVAVYLLGI
ncbi:MerR family transcriptional regulator [Lachnospiraceae bacterium 38-14]